jgi:DNA-binding GntR family transcriptional regulator
VLLHTRTRILDFAHNVKQNRGVTLAAWVRDDLRSRLPGGAGEGLTLRALSGRYGCSLTPVRRAVAALVREGVLVRKAGGRLEAAPGRRARPAPPPPKPGAWERGLERDVLRAGLRGEAGFLREEAAARRLGTGRTALRRALARLAAAGLVEHVPRRGWRVRPFRDAEMDAFLEVREALELKALDLALPRLEPAELRALLEENRPGRGPDARLHELLVERAGNPYLADFFRRHGAYFSTLFHSAARHPDAGPLMAAHHRRILRALIERRLPAARRLLAAHIRAQAPVLRRLLRRLAELPAADWPEGPA